jgi:regulator of sigma E protease
MDTFIIAIGAFIPLLLLLVVVHEFGHFATARMFGVKVLEFGIGYPPRAFSLYTGRTHVTVDQQTDFVNLQSLSDLRIGQVIKVSSVEGLDGNLVARRIESAYKGARGKITRPSEEPIYEQLLRHEGKVREVSDNSFTLADMLYSLNWAPLGGFVRLAGENDPAVPRSLASKGTGTRFLVLAAGPLMNAILPIIVFAILFMIPTNVTVGTIIVSEVIGNSPAEAAGVREGDVIIRAGDHKIENRGDLTRAINLNRGSTMEWLISREGRTEIILLNPQYDDSESRWLAGIFPDLVDARIESHSDAPWIAIPRSFSSTWDLVVLLKREVGDWVTGERTPELSGPIGIAQTTGEVTQQGGVTGWLAMVILFSINLAILNILPIPMLDGGRIFFVILEWMRRGKRIPPKKEGLVHAIGFVVLISTIILISARDIERLVQGKSLLGG